MIALAPECQLERQSQNARVAAATARARVGVMLRRTAFALFVIAALAPSPASVGSPAPPFDLQGSDGERYTLEKFEGKRGVVLAWFPKAFTPG